MAESVKLEAADQEDVRKDLGLVDAKEVSAVPGQDRALDKKADEVVDALLNMKGDKEEAKLKSKASIEAIGGDLQRKAALQSEKLRDPLTTMAGRSEDGGSVAKSLIDLRVQVEKLDPARFDFDAGWFSRVVGYVPGVGTPLKRYFSRYESAQTVIGAIVKSLEIGREQIKRDNITLGEDQKRMREYSEKLVRAVKFAQLLDAKLAARAESGLADDLSTFVKEELLFPLRQRIMDLQQQLAVNQQGVLAMEILVRNNKELVRGVDRALNVTVSALQVAVTVAMALADQKIVLDKVQALSGTTSDLIASTAERLKTQGAEIHKQASRTQLDIDSLKKAFLDIHAAMEDIAQFRTRALPAMAESIRQMEDLNTDAAKAIAKMEKGNKAAPVIPIELE